MVSEAAKKSVQGFTLTNGEMNLTVRPDLGGRIDQVQDCRTGRNWLWHPKEYDASQIRSLPVGANFDDHWTGGWDEIFPNDVAGPFRGRELADHGELWSQPWDVLVASSYQIKLAYQCQTIPVRVEKIIHLDATQPNATIAYRFENQSNDRIPFLLKQHAALVIEPDDEILLPDCTIEPVALEFSKLIGQPGKTRFPKTIDATGKEIQINRIPPASSQLQEFYYCSDLAIGECGIRNQTTQSALKMQFDSADFPYVWVFQSYGGWKNHYVLVMEPATTIPYDLEVACQNGTVAYLEPNEVQQRQLKVCFERVTGNG